MNVGSVTVNERLRARVRGTVQGVGFRYFTRESAARLEITGWVRNRPDGSVELVAEGPRANLELLLERVTAGPEQSSVSGVESDWSEATGEFESFVVRA